MGKQFHYSTHHTFAMQSMLAGNFINVALYLTALSIGDFISMACLIGSWGAAYISGAVFHKPRLRNILGYICVLMSVLVIVRLTYLYV